MKVPLHSTSDASRLAALLLPQILPVFSVVAPCQPGAALRDLCHDPLGQDTGRESRATRCVERWVVHYTTGGTKTAVHDERGLKDGPVGVVGGLSACQNGDRA